MPLRVKHRVHSRVFSQLGAFCLRVARQGDTHAQGRLLLFDLSLQQELF